MRRYLMFILCLMVIIIMPVLTACRPTEPVFPLEPRVLILSPAPDSVFSSGSVMVKAYVENVNLVDKVGQDNVPGEGHLIYYLDAIPPVKLGESAIPSTGDYKISTDLHYTWPDLASGEHILAVQVVNNDNTPIRYPSAVRVNIAVK